MITVFGHIQYSDIKFALFELCQLNLSEQEWEQLGPTLELTDDQLDWVQRLADAGNTVILF